MKVMLVQGTWSFDAAWWKASSPFVQELTKRGHTVINGRPFVWDTELGGIGFGDKDLRGWQAAGLHLWDRLDPPTCASKSCRIPASDLCIIAHSHGRQVVKFACNAGLAAAKVIFVSGPVRKDVDEATLNARSHIGHLVCINGGRRDRFQWVGELFDGHRGIERKDPQADDWKQFPDADHSSPLNDPKQFDYVLRYL
jgi:hypothetical protein